MMEFQQNSGTILYALIVCVLPCHLDTSCLSLSYLRHHFLSTKPSLTSQVCMCVPRHPCVPQYLALSCVIVLGTVLSFPVYLVVALPRLWSPLRAVAVFYFPLCLTRGTCCIY